jgi:hypothetical protein
MRSISLIPYTFSAAGGGLLSDDRPIRWQRGG